ncbi:MAG: outer membrane protein assembly factor BamA [Deltaproteobacteria bacterium]|nr:outer membrane protein assembly factor BamA [Deltaproteobacteria bacterium]
MDAIRNVFLSTTLRQQTGELSPRAGVYLFAKPVSRWIRSVGVLMVLAAVLFFPLTAAAETRATFSRTKDVVANIEVRVKTDGDRSHEWHGIAEAIISLYVRVGAIFSPDDVNASLSALKECNKFNEIHVDSRAGEKGVTLIYSLTPFKRIKDIRIKGKYPLFEIRVLNAMTVYPGDAYVQDVIDDQAKLIADLYKQEGYIDPSVVIGGWEDPEDHQYVLFVTINKGPYYSLGRVAFDGNRSFEDNTLHWRMRSWRKATFGRIAGRFRQQVFKKDIDNLRQFYRKMHFFDARITFDLKPNPAGGKMDVEVAIQEGARYDIRFEGNTAFGAKTLGKQLAFKESGNRRDIGLRKSIKHIKALYHNAGYPEIRVAAKEKVAVENGVKKRTIVLEIKEGPRFMVERVNISGNKALKERKLRRQILTRAPGLLHDGALVEGVLQEDLLMLKNMYHKKGYLDPEISVEKSPAPVEENRHPVVVDFHIDEGVRTVITAIELEGLVRIQPASVYAAMQMETGKPFRWYALKNEERNIAQVVSEMGHPHVTVDSRTAFNEDHSGVRVTFVIDEGPFVQMGQTVYSGNFRTKKRILEREIEMRPGDPFSLQRMVTGQKNIRAMNIFRSVQFRPVGLEDKKERVHLFAEVDEKPPYFFQANAGYESVKGIYAGSRVGDHNFLGLNKDVWVGGEVSQTGYWAESRMFEPRFFGTRISSDMGLYFKYEEPFNQVFGTRKYGTDLLLSKKLTQRISANLGLRGERREQFGRGGNVGDDEEGDFFRSFFTTSPSVAYDSRDSFIRPRKGIFSFFAVDLSKGIENSYDDFYKYRFELRGFTTPLRRLTLAGRGSFGDIQPYGSKGVVPQDQLFFLGGTASVRGFDENLFLYDTEDDPVGGQMAAVASAEARFDLGRNFEFSLFYDVGYLDDTSGLEVTDNVRDSAGLGLRYVTPIGAMGILYGHKLDARPEESPGRIHFSVGYTF